MFLKKYCAKGLQIFCYIDNQIKYITVPFDEEVRQIYDMVGDLYSGEEFYKMADNGSIIDYDGKISHVYVNGYDSNLGLVYKGIMQGKFMVDGETWLNICKNNKVEVEWCNK